MATWLCRSSTTGRSRTSKSDTICSFDVVQRPLYERAIIIRVLNVSRFRPRTAAASSEYDRKQIFRADKFRSIKFASTVLAKKRPFEGRLESTKRGVQTNTHGISRVNRRNADVGCSKHSALRRVPYSPPWEIRARIVYTAAVQTVSQEEHELLTSSAYSFLSTVFTKHSGPRSWRFISLRIWMLNESDGDSPLNGRQRNVIDLR